MRPIVVVRGRQRPHELLLLAWSLAWGVTYLLGAPAPASMTELPRWEVLAWAAVLVASGALGLLGCWWRRDMRLGLGLELAAMLIGAGALLLFSVAAVVFAGGLTFGGGLVIAWTGANLWRAAQIERALLAERAA